MIAGQPKLSIERRRGRSHGRCALRGGRPAVSPWTAERPVVRPCVRSGETHWIVRRAAGLAAALVRGAPLAPGPAATLAPERGLAARSVSASGPERAPAPSRRRVGVSPCQGSGRRLGRRRTGTAEGRAALLGEFRRGDG